MISPTTPGGRASRSASVGARGLGLVVLMAHLEGSTGGAVLAESPIAAPDLQVYSSHAGHGRVDLETTPGATARGAISTPHHRQAPGLHLGPAPARPFHAHPPPASIGTNRRRKPQGDRFAESSMRKRGCEILAVRNTAVSLLRSHRAPKSHSRGQGFDPPWL